MARKTKKILFTDFPNPSASTHWPAAGMRWIKFHGTRHTCATLLLKAGVPVPVESERLGHKGVEITMNIYQHVLPDMQEDAAEKLGAILF